MQSPKYQKTLGPNFSNPSKSKLTNAPEFVPSGKVGMFPANKNNKGTLDPTISKPAVSYINSNKGIKDKAELEKNSVEDQNTNKSENGGSENNGIPNAGTGGVGGSIPSAFNDRYLSQNVSQIEKNPQEFKPGSNFHGPANVVNAYENLQANRTQTGYNPNNKNFHFQPGTEGNQGSGGYNRGHNQNQHENHQNNLHTGYHPSNSAAHNGAGQNQNPQISHNQQNSFSLETNSNSGAAHQGHENSWWLENEKNARIDKCQYLKQLLQDKKQLQNFAQYNNYCFHHLARILEDEIIKVRSVLFKTDQDNLPIQLPNPIGPTIVVTEKVFVPVKDYPDYNFVGRILGPRGLTAKQLEQDTQCKIMVRGEGSMRDKKAEDAKRGKQHWEHLSDPLHVLITAEDSENRAKIKISKAKNEIEKLLVPQVDGEDGLKKKQLMELAIINGTYRDNSSPAKNPKMLNNYTTQLMLQPLALLQQQGFSNQGQPMVLNAGTGNTFNAANQRNATIGNNAGGIITYQAPGVNTYTARNGQQLLAGATPFAPATLSQNTNVVANSSATNNSASGDNSDASRGGANSNQIVTTTTANAVLQQQKSVGQQFQNSQATNVAAVAQNGQQQLVGMPGANILLTQPFLGDQANHATYYAPTPQYFATGAGIIYAPQAGTVAAANTTQMGVTANPLTNSVSLASALSMNGSMLVQNQKNLPTTQAQLVASEQATIVQGGMDEGMRTGESSPAQNM